MVKIANEILSDHDRYVQSKYYPGKVEPDWCYSPSGEMSSAAWVGIKGALSSSAIWNATGTAPLGTYDYVLIMFWPALSHLAVHPGFTGALDGQPSGFCIIGAEDENKKVAFTQFLGANNTGTEPRGDSSWLSMESLYGSTTDTALDSFVYAARMNFNFLIPAANRVTGVYKGQFRLGQLLTTSNKDAAVATEVSIQQLLRAGTRISAGHTTFSLQSSLVNDYLLARTDPGYTEDFYDEYLSKNDLRAEIVEYAVIQTASKNILDGSNALYSLQYEIDYSASIMPSFQNMILFRKFSPTKHRKQEKYYDWQFSPIDTEVLDKYPIPLTYGDLEEFESEINKNNGYIDLDDVSTQITADTLSEPQVRLEDKIPTTRSEEGSGILVEPRMVSAVRRIVGTYKPELEGMGIKFPLQFAMPGSAVISGIKLATNTLTHEAAKKLVNERNKEAFRQDVVRVKRAGKSFKEATSDAAARVLKKDGFTKPEIDELVQHMIESSDKDDNTKLKALKHVDIFWAKKRKSGYRMPPIIPKIVKKYYGKGGIKGIIKSIEAKQNENQ